MLGPTWHLVDRFWSSLGHARPFNTRCGDTIGGFVTTRTTRPDLFGRCDKENGGITVN